MFLIKSFTFNPILENTYILYHSSGECIIIDPGCYFDDEKEVIETFITDNGLKPVMLLNTHCHLDHVFGNKFIAETYRLTLHIHPLEKEIFNLAPASGLLYDLPFDNYSGVFLWLNEGDTLRLGEDEMSVIHVPGHSPGSVCFYCKSQKFLIGGDVLFQRSIGRTDLPGGDHDTLLQQIRKKIFVLPDDVIVYPGHGAVTSIGEEKKYNPFF